MRKLNEFQLIDHFFKNKSQQRSDVLLGIGDDAAVMRIPDGYDLVFSTDTLVAGLHFDDLITSFDLGYKSLAVNLSDLAAMGAMPAWFSLNLTMPNIDQTWISQFSAGMFELANTYNMQLIGGDTTCGPLSVSMQVFGFTKKHKTLKRSGAKTGDLIFVSGCLGNAACALKENNKTLQKSLFHPIPRIELGLQLIDIATSCIDISDGLAADLSHILQASCKGAQINLQQLPTNNESAKKYALTGGDDYELCFTIPAATRYLLQERATQLDCKITCIGTIQDRLGLYNSLTGELLVLNYLGWEHFKENE